MVTEVNMGERRRVVRRDMLRDPIELQLPGEPDLQTAMAAAWQVAREQRLDPMLLAWYDRTADRWSPPVDCCGEDEPAWLVYARSRGGDLDVTVDGDRYVFVFWGEPRPE